MADRYRDDEHDRGDRPSDAWRERDQRWRAREGDRPLSQRASDEVRSWFGDDEARRRRELDEGREERGGWREQPERERGRYEHDPREYAREPRDLRAQQGGAWGRPEYGTTYDRDRDDRGARGYSGSDLNRERDFGRSDRSANADEGIRYGSRPVENRPPGYARGEGSYRGTSGYETGRGAGGFASWGRLGASRTMSTSPDWESGPFVGRGPRGYQRADDRIRDEVCERLTRHGRIDASDINIRVLNGEVTLDGSVDDRESKRLAEDVAESVFGVRDVNNQIKVYRAETPPVGTAGRSSPGEPPPTNQNPGSAIGLAGTANTPEVTPPDREEPRKA